MDASSPAYKLWRAQNFRAVRGFMKHSGYA